MSTRYQLSLFAENLPKRWRRAPSSYAVATVTGGPHQGKTLGQTETIARSCNPEWVKTMFFYTDSSVFMPIKVSIYAHLAMGRDPELLAEGNFEATEIHQSAGHTQFVQDMGIKIHASVQESQRGPAKGLFNFHLRGLDMKNVEPGLLGLGRSDPFFELARKNADPASGYVRWNVVHRSEYIDNHLNPYWKPASLSVEELCYGDLDCPLKVTVFDYQKDGKHRKIGEVETTLQGLMDRVAIRGNADRERGFRLFKEDQETVNRGLSEMKTRGLLIVLKAELQLESN